MTGTATPGVLPTLRFRLPGSWWQVPLHDEAEAEASIRRLVDSQVGRGDEHATLRRELRDELLDSARTAIGGNGQSMQIALDIIETLPLSASFTVFLPEVGMTPALGTEPSAVLSVLEKGLAASDPSGFATASRSATPESAVLRIHRQRLVPADGERPEQAALSVEYWITVPGTKRVVLVAFSTAFVELEDVMLQLFDSIIALSYWQSQNT